MKIALVSPYDYSRPGGVVHHISSLAYHLRQLGHETQVLGPCARGKEPIDDTLINVSGSILPIRYSGSVARITISPRMYHRVKNILQREKFDVIHIHEPLTVALPPVIIHQVLNNSCPVVVGTFHAYRVSSAPYNYAHTLFDRFFQRLDGHIAVSEAARQYISGYFPADYRVIPNGINLERFGSHIEPLPRYVNHTEHFNILFVGRLEERKGFRYLLRAFSYVKNVVPTARLLVIGSYSEEDKAPFLRQVRRYDIQDVEFIGFVPADKLARYYRSAHLFCAPSTGFESFGLVLLEAMASGVPIIASDIPGYRCVLGSNEVGVAVPPMNSQAIASAIISLLRDPARRKQLAEQGQKKAARYAWQRVTERILDYYEELRTRKGIQTVSYQQPLVRRRRVPDLLQ